MRQAMPLFITAILLGGACSDGGTGWAELPGVGVLGVLAGDAYVCGIDEAVDQSRWLSGDAALMGDDDGIWELTVERDGTYLLTDERGESWSGGLTAFDAGGLYDAVTGDCRSGAVVYQDTLAGTWCDGVGGFQQVEPVDPFTGGPPEILVHRADEPDEHFTLQRVQ